MFGDVSSSWCLGSTALYIVTLSTGPPYDHFGFVDFTSKQMINNNEKFRSFKSKENIHKKKVGPYRGFSFKASSVTL